MRTLITGACGFLGLNLRQHLLNQGWAVEGTYRQCSSLAKQHYFYYLDITNAADVKYLVNSIGPDVIFHFAGQAFVQASFQDPQYTFSVNAGGTLNVLEAAKAIGCRVVLAGSGTEYGPYNGGCTEDQPLNPTSPYAASKVAAEVLCQQYFRAFNTDAVTMRIFGTTGPGKRSDAFTDFASQVVACERGQASEIRVGQLSMRRDIQDVRDAVRAFQLVAEKGQAGRTYNIGTGYAVSMADVLGYLNTANYPVVTDPFRMRPGDEPIHLANVHRLRTELGYEPTISLPRTAADILEHLRANIK